MTQRTNEVLTDHLADNLRAAFIECIVQMHPDCYAEVCERPELFARTFRIRLDQPRVINRSHRRDHEQQWEQALGAWQRYHARRRASLATYPPPRAARAVVVRDLHPTMDDNAIDAWATALVAGLKAARAQR